MIRRPLLALVLACVFARPGLAHEFWIEPSEFQVETGAELTAQLRVGEKLKGTPQAYFPNRITRFEQRYGDVALPYEGRLGDIPALAMQPDRDGLLVLLHQTAPSTLDYKAWEKFQAFADHKDFPDIRERHLTRGLPLDGFTEIYTRFAKSLIAIGSGAGTDTASGMETEFVALTNPYTDPITDGIAVQLFYQGQPHPNAQVEIFDRAPDGGVTVTLTHTDAQGRALIPVKSGHDYLLDAVRLRPYDGPEEAVWESLWASLTFAVP
ncbi:DUF4198 domain-containing protein [Ruegeria sp. 2205SS24-7]|uniref:DUF4198 domain-containing protein n=1 Tax=Ruegeria discodermiae TaxID=3064389 RepID=UPI00274298A7|nr:DUF4198 domain-containing protein [Ruegeria sp. 2205SS24-7]MDP5216268.1 DUF4198 domain-containing protein [Ruegeria sp. 2205SS24-7]